jgi:ATP-dependent Clp protease protease subunit
MAEAAPRLSRKPDRSGPIEPGDEARAGLLRRRVVLLDREVDTTCANAAIAQLLFLDGEDREAEIRLVVNAPGGDLGAGLALYDVVRRSRAPIATVCVGTAGGVAALALASGRRGARSAAANARVRLELGPASASGDMRELRLRTKELETLADRFARALAEVTGRHLEEIEHDLEHPRVLSAEDAIRYGIVDALLRDDPRIA